MSYLGTKEEIERNLNLKDLLEGRKQGPLLEKPGLDRPWLKEYSRDVIAMDMPGGTLYDNLVESNKDNMRRIALNYFDRKITYSEFIKNINDVAKALEASGVKAHDMVSIASVSTPETVYLFYALSKIGAVGNLIDPRSSTQNLHHYIEESDSKLLFVIESDEYTDKLLKAKEGTSVEEVFSISPIASASVMYKSKAIYGAVKEARKNAEDEESILDIIKDLKFNRPEGVKSWNDFYIRSVGREDSKIVHDKDNPAVLIHTGGTSGKSKGVLLSNYNLNAACKQSQYSGFNFKTGHKWLNIMPPFIAYGVGNGLHLPLTCGMEVVLIPNFEPRKFGELVKKYKFNHVTGVPSHYDDLINSKALKGENLSYCMSLIMGGDKAKVRREEVINDFLKKHNCKYKVSKGYGMTEVSAAVCATGKDELNKLGSVGIPFPSTTIAIFDAESKDPRRDDSYSDADQLGYDEIGEVCMTGPNIMIGYFNNNEEEKAVLKVHEDGKVWVHSQDLGKIDKDGCVYILDRMKNLVALHTGFKLYPENIENVILNHPAIDECKVVGVQDPDHFHGMRPYVYVTLKKDIDLSEDEIIEQLSLLCEAKLADYSQPLDYKIKDAFPITKVGKIDENALRDEYNDSLKGMCRVRTL